MVSHGYNLPKAGVALAAGVLAGSAALTSFGFNIAFGWWWCDTAAALAMLPVFVWQEWHSFAEARETEEAEARGIRKETSRRA